MNRTPISVVALLLLLAACGSADDEAPPAAPAPEATSVRVVTVPELAVQPWLYGQGTARAVKREFLTFPSAGRVAFVDPRLKVGDKVRKGQLIAYQQPDRAEAELANARAGVASAQTELAAARASQREAAANLQLARATFSRFEILLAKDSASQQEFDRAEAEYASAQAASARADAQIDAILAKARSASAQLDQAGVSMGESRIVSPIDGVLARLNIGQGDYFSPQTVQSTSEQGALSTIPVFIIDPSTYEIAVDLPARAIDAVVVGAEVRLSVGEYNDRQGADGPNPPESGPVGRVYSVTPSIDPEKRSFQLNARTTQSARWLRDGQFVSIWIAGVKAQPAPAVPQEALRYQDGQPFVFEYRPDTETVARRDLRLGASGRGVQAVIEGLAAGAQVVTDGRAGLDDGDRVRLLAPAAGASAALR